MLISSQLTKSGPLSAMMPSGQKAAAISLKLLSAARVWLTPEWVTKQPISLSGDQRDVERRSVLRLKKKLERKYQRSVAIILRRAATASASALRHGLDPLGAEYLTTGMIEDLEKLIRRQGREVSDIFALRTWKGFKSFSQLETKQDEILDYSAFIEEWLATHAATKAVLIGATTAGIVQRAMIAADREGLSIPQTATLIRARAGGQMSAIRAARIARTEVNAVANVGNEAAAVATGEELIREWLSVEDGRTRPTHNRADGQTREVGEPFNVGGSELMRPGDPNGPARETINCRCTLIFEPKDDDDE